MKKLFLGSVALAALVAGPAIAADLPSKAAPPPPAPVFSWTGVYFGVNGGYGWQSQTTDPVQLFTNDTTPVNLGDATAASRGTIGDIRAAGGFGGFQVGYNYQFAPYLLVGIETDFQGSGIKGDTGPARFTNPNGTFPHVGAADVQLNWFGTVRGRVGFTASNWLFYGTGGFAFGNVEYKLTVNEVGGAALFTTQMSAKETTGWVAGGGIEWGVTPNISVKAEYQYLDFGTLAASSPVRFLATGLPTGETAFSNEIKTTFHTVRVGLNARFWP
jgi:outer membrane immunogenic protein